MRQAEDRRASDPESHLLSMLESAGVSDILDAFGDPEGEFADEPGVRPSRGESAEDPSVVTNDGPFPDVPDADALAAGTPVDPAAPRDGFHGTDLLNGAD